VLIYLAILGVRILKAAENSSQTRLGLALLTALFLQIGLGIANVVGHLPLPVAVAHNGGAALLLLVLVTLLYAQRPISAAGTNRSSIEV